MLYVLLGYVHNCAYLLATKGLLQCAYRHDAIVYETVCI